MWAHDPDEFPRTFNTAHLTGKFKVDLENDHFFGPLDIRPREWTATKRGMYCVNALEKYDILYLASVLSGTRRS